MMKTILVSSIAIALLTVGASAKNTETPAKQEQSASAKQIETTLVTDENYSLAETDGVIEGYVKKIAAATNTNGVGVFMHNKTGADPKDRTVMRINFDTLYSIAVLDLTEPATLTMPETNGRYQTAWFVSEDGYYPGAFTKPGEHQITKEWNSGERYAIVFIRTQVNTKDPADLAKAHALQDKLKLTQKDRGSWVPRNYWDKKEVEAMRTKYQKIAAEMLKAGGDLETGKMFGKKGQVSLKGLNAGNSYGWGGFSPDQAIYPQYFPKTAAPQTLTLKDVPVKAFWSITVYDNKGFPQTDTYNINSSFAQKDKDGSVTIHFGGDKNAKNYMETFDGWNFTLRMYQPTDMVLNDKWKKPKLQLVK